MTLSIACFTAAGEALAQRLEIALRAEGEQVRRRDRIRSKTSPSLGEWAAEGFALDDALVFIGASGIAVRAIAPLVRDKHTDPAVVTVDEGGRFVVPLLSGHVGGANDLARQIAVLLGAQPVISTATDLNGRFAVDVWAKHSGVVLDDPQLAKAISAALLEGQTVGICSDFPLNGTLPRGLVDQEKTELGLYITLDGEKHPFQHTLLAIPQIVTLGIGCRRGTSLEVLEGVVDRFLALVSIDRRSVRGVATIDRKREEAGLVALCASRGWPLRWFTAGQLAAVEGHFTTSAFVQETVGVDNVCERAAVLAGGKLLAPKYQGMGVTVAAAILNWQPCLAEKEEERE